VVLYYLTERFTNQDLAGSGFGTEAARHVDRVTDDRVFQPTMAPDIAGEDLPVVDPDTHADFGTSGQRPLLIQSSDAVLHGDGGTQRPVRIIGVRNGGAPEGHDGITDEFVQRTAVLEDDLDHLAEIFRQ